MNVSLYSTKIILVKIYSCLTVFLGRYKRVRGDFNKCGNEKEGVALRTEVGMLVYTCRATSAVQLSARGLSFLCSLIRITGVSRLDLDKNLRHMPDWIDIKC